VDAGRRRDRRGWPLLRDLVPGGIRGQDEAGHPARRAQRRRHGRGASAASVSAPGEVRTSG